VTTALAVMADGLVYAAWLFIVAVGLTRIFGVMKILNVAHGSLYAFGAYTAASAIGFYFDRGLPLAGGYLVMLGSAVTVGLVVGIMLERGLLRRFYGRAEIVSALVTYAVFLILEDVLVLIWGSQGYFAYQPYTAAGTIDLGNLPVSRYDIALVALAALLAVGGWYGLRRTAFGRKLITVIYDRELAAAFGVNVSRIYLITFVIGSVLGALGGALTAPKISVTPGIGVEVIVIAFAVVAIGGMGSIEGALVGALIVGLCRAAAVHLAPSLDLFVVYAVMASVLVLRPYGLFTRAQARKI
jgi:branched-chain amino acid transport system permease protein